MKYRNEIIGRRFGMLTPIRCEGYAFRSKRTLWLCRCDCGREKVVRSDCLRAGSSRSCGCVLHRKRQQSHSWRGHKDISLSYWNRLVRDARKRGLLFTISIQEAWRVFERQQGRCALSDEPICFGDRKLNGTASLDRIDSDAGYVPRNIQWVHKVVNAMKMQLPQQDFISFCCKISRCYHRSSEPACQAG